MNSTTNSAILSKTPKFTIKSTLSEAWIQLGGYVFTFWISLLISAVMVAIPLCLPSIITLILKTYHPLRISAVDQNWKVLTTLCGMIGLLLTGLMLTGLKVQAAYNIENKSAQVKQLFSCFKHPFKILLITVPVMITFVIPPLGFIMFVFFHFADTLILKDNLSVTAALGMSFRIARNNFPGILGTSVACIFIFIISLSLFLIHIRLWTMLISSALLFLYLPFLANVHGVLYKKLSPKK